VGDSPLCLTFPDLFDKCSTPELPICQALTVEGWNIQFRRNLNPDEAQQWNELLVLVQDLRLQEVPDRVSWRLEPSGRFSTRSLYRALCNGPKLPLTKLIWNPRIPLKIKIFTWLSCRGRLPSNNLIRARGASDGNCALCGLPESVDHILFQCILAKFMWSGVRSMFGVNWNPRSL
jgi:hypothetical protein